MESPGYGAGRRLEPGLNTELKLSVQVLIVDLIFVLILILIFVLDL